MKDELKTLGTANSELEKKVRSLSDECTSLHARIAVYQEDLKMDDQAREGYEATISENRAEAATAKEELAVTKREMEEEKAKNAELMDEFVRVGIKAM